jgi:hypothetical protein
LTALTALQETEYWSSCIDEDIIHGLLGCDAVWSCMWLPTVWRTYITSSLHLVLGLLNDLFFKSQRDSRVSLVYTCSCHYVVSAKLYNCNLLLKVLNIFIWIYSVAGEWNVWFYSQTSEEESGASKMASVWTASFATGEGTVKIFRILSCSMFFMYTYMHAYVYDTVS